MDAGRLAPHDRIAAEKFQQDCILCYLFKMVGLSAIRNGHRVQRSGVDEFPLTIIMSDGWTLGELMDAGDARVDYEVNRTSKTISRLEHGNNRAVNSLRDEAKAEGRVQVIDIKCEGAWMPFILVDQCRQVYAAIIGKMHRDNIGKSRLSLREATA